MCVKVNVRFWYYLLYNILGWGGKGFIKGGGSLFLIKWCLLLIKVGGGGIMMLEGFGFKLFFVRKGLVKDNVRRGYFVMKFLIWLNILVFWDKIVVVIFKISRVLM